MTNVLRSLLRARRLLALLVAAALVLAACGGDDDDPVAAASDDATAEVSDDEMSDDEMAEDEMSDDEMMSDEEMSDDEMMSDEEMSDDEMMSDEEMSDDEMMSDEEMADGEMMSDDDMAEAMNDLMSVIIGRGDLSILDDAVHAADLQDVLHDEGPFTIFAPTNAAFEAYLGQMGMSADEALADADTLAALLQAHIVSGTNDASMVVDLAGGTLTTLAGTELAITVDGDVVTVGDATVLEVDVVADNGVIHVIDTVLSPPAS